MGRGWGRILLTLPRVQNHNGTATYKFSFRSDGVPFRKYENGVGDRTKNKTQKSSGARDNNIVCRTFRNGPYGLRESWPKVLVLLVQAFMFLLKETLFLEFVSNYSKITVHRNVTTRRWK